MLMLPTVCKYIQRPIPGFSSMLFRLPYKYLHLDIIVDEKTQITEHITGSLGRLRPTGTSYGAMVES